MALAATNNGRVSRYLREVRAELRKVNWPNRKELATYTVVVVVSVLAIAAFIGLVDLLFSQILAIIARLRG